MNAGKKQFCALLLIQWLVLQGIIFSYSPAMASPINSNKKNSNSSLSDESEKQTPAEDRVLFAPPTFPYWGPFGFTSTAILCPWFVGPFGGSWNRACAGPVPPFKRTTTTTPKPQKKPKTTPEPSTEQYQNQNTEANYPNYSNNYPYPNQYSMPNYQQAYASSNNNYYYYPNYNNNGGAAPYPVSQ